MVFVPSRLLGCPVVVELLDEIEYFVFRQAIYADFDRLANSKVLS